MLKVVVSKTATRAVWSAVIDGCGECVVCQRSRRGQNNARTRDGFALWGGGVVCTFLIAQMSSSRRKIHLMKALQVRQTYEKLSETATVYLAVPDIGDRLSGIQEITLPSTALRLLTLQTRNLTERSLARCRPKTPLGRLPSSGA